MLRVVKKIGTCFVFYGNPPGNEGIVKWIDLIFFLKKKTRKKIRAKPLCGVDQKIDCTEMSTNSWGWEAALWVFLLLL